MRTVLYQSVESFWQGLKFSDRARRREIAEMPGKEAKRIGSRESYGPTVRYGDRDVVVGTWEHWQLMRQACVAKFAQHAEARAALKETAPRPLVHHMRRDSHTIPGVIMAEIWMSLRQRFLGVDDVPGEDNE